MNSQSVGDLVGGKHVEDEKKEKAKDKIKLRMEIRRGGLQAENDYKRKRKQAMDE